MNSEEIMDKNTEKKEENYFIMKQVNDIRKERNRLFLKLIEGQIVLEFVSSDIVRVVMGKKGELDLSTSIAVLNHNNQYDDFTVDNKDNELEIITNSLKIAVNKKRFALGFYDLEDNLIHRDYSKYALGWRKDTVKAWKEIRPEERFYGLGEKTGYLDKKGKKYTMWNTDTFDPHVASTDPLYQSIPFLIGFESGVTYGIYFDNTYRTHFDLGSAGEEYYSFQAEGGSLDYYFIYDADIKGVIKKYTSLTGRIPLPPKWALGYHQSRFSYYPEKRVREIAKNFRERDIPCDAIHLDIHYMDDYKVFTWDENEFSEPEKMLNDLGRDGFKIVTIVSPGVKKDARYQLYREGVEKDYFCKYFDGKYFTGKVWPGECLFPDFTKEVVRKWWGDRQKILVDQGIKGIWNDMNEPAVFNEDSTMDLEVVHDNDGDIGTHRRFHNIYGMLECQASYEGLKKYRPQERPFVLTRAGFAGIQRYAAVWTGDNRSFWEHLRLAIPMLLNLGLSGVVFAGMDVGGFAYDCDGELLVRWTQLGAFVPFFRNHCAMDNVDQEPWAFNDQVEDIIRKYIKLRYKFLTHIYNLFYQASENGLPVMRPLVLEYPHDRKTYNLSDQFMLGDSILVAPVCHPDREERIVYLPPGEWYNFWTGKEVEGDTSTIVEAPLDILPIFIKSGSIIPMVTAMNYVGEKKIGQLEVDIYLSQQLNTNSYKLYQDDGLSFDYQKGVFNQIEFSYQYESDRLLFNIEVLHEEYETEYDDYLLRFIKLQNKPLEILADGEKIKDWQYNDQQLIFKIAESIRRIEIKL